MVRRSPDPFAALREWVKTLPPSRMVYPTDSLFDRVKYAFWRIYTPFHSLIRDLLVVLGFRKALRAIGLITCDSRQEFLLGTISPSHTHETVITYLIEEGYGNHFVAWKDSGQIASLRKAVDFRYQYHVRIFEDGEIRGHYEFTPEYRPWRHLRQIGQEDHRETFLRLLGDRIVPV